MRFNISNRLYWKFLKKINISNLKNNNRTPEFFDMSIDIEVRDAKHLTAIIAALRAIPEIKQVERSRS